VILSVLAVSCWNEPLALFCVDICPAGLRQFADPAAGGKHDPYCPFRGAKQVSGREALVQVDDLLLGEVAIPLLLASADLFLGQPRQRVGLDPFPRNGEIEKLP
jgi:hypothetical protein